MFILRYRISKALLLFGAMALVGLSCDADDTEVNGGEDAWSGADAPVDTALLVDRAEESETMGVADASDELAAADVPNEVTGDDAEETTAPVPRDLRTATFALG